MRIIINRDVSSYLSEIVTIINGQETVSCPFKQDYCEVKAEDGDHIEVILKFMDQSMLILASFRYKEENNLLLIYPALFYKLWIVATYAIIPYISIFLLVLKPIIDTRLFDWTCVGFILLTAISIFTLKVSILIPYIRNRLFLFKLFQRDEPGL